MDELTILLVEDDPQACKRFIECADELDALSIVSITNNVTKALEDIQYFYPNIIILDLELHLGSGNGIEILSRLKDLNIHPYILVTTNNTSNLTHECARQLGADFIMSKHQKDYSEKGVLEFLQMMKSVIKGKNVHAFSSLPTTESPELYRKRITRRIMQELNTIGISPKELGYQYLTDGICIFIEKPIQNVCSKIAQQYGKSEASVERAMQNSLGKAWKRNDIDELLKHYTAPIHSEKGVPTITEFLSYYAHKLKNEY